MQCQHLLLLAQRVETRLQVGEVLVHLQRLQRLQRRRQAAPAELHGDREQEVFLGREFGSRREVSEQTGLEYGGTIEFEADTNTNFMVLLDTSIVNNAVPAIQASLGASSGQIQLVLDAYLLAYAADYTSYYQDAMATDKSTASSRTCSTARRVSI